MRHLAAQLVLIALIPLAGVLTIVGVALWFSARKAAGSAKSDAELIRSDSSSMDSPAARDAVNKRFNAYLRAQRRARWMVGVGATLALISIAFFMVFRNVLFTQFAGHVPLGATAGKRYDNLDETMSALERSINGKDQAETQALICQEADLDVPLHESVSDDFSHGKGSFLSVMRDAHVTKSADQLGEAGMLDVVAQVQVAGLVFERSESGISVARDTDGNMCLIVGSGATFKFVKAVNTTDLPSIPEFLASSDSCSASVGATSQALADSWEAARWIRNDGSVGGLAKLSRIFFCSPGTQEQILSKLRTPESLEAAADGEFDALTVTQVSSNSWSLRSKPHFEPPAKLEMNAEETAAYYAQKKPVLVANVTKDSKGFRLESVSTEQVQMKKP